jgi:hypothetical protein
MLTFLAKIKATIAIDDFLPPSLQRLHDFVITDVVHESDAFTAAEIRRKNAVDCTSKPKAYRTSLLCQAPHWIIISSKESGHCKAAAVTEIQYTKNGRKAQRGPSGGE